MTSHVWRRAARVEVPGELVRGTRSRGGRRARGRHEQPVVPLTGPRQRAEVGVAALESELPLVDQLAAAARATGWSDQRTGATPRQKTRIRSGQRGVLASSADPAAQPVTGHGQGSRPRCLHRAAVGPPQPLHDLDGGRLARAVRSEEAEELASMDVERDAVGNYLLVAPERLTSRSTDTTGSIAVAAGVVAPSSRSSWVDRARRSVWPRSTVDFAPPPVGGSWPKFRASWVDEPWS